MLRERCLVFVLNCYIEKKKDMVGFYFFSEFSSIRWNSSPADLYFYFFKLFSGFRVFSGDVEHFASVLADTLLFLCF